MSTSRRLICSAGLVVLGILAAAPMTAGAAEPVISTRTITVSTPSPSISCRPYGYSFGTLATFTAEFHLTIPYGANLTRTFDPAANTITITGLFRYTHPDGSGMVALDAGRTFVVPPTVISDTGPTMVEWQMAVCAALAAE